MSLVIYRVIFFCLVPLGVFILVKAIGLLRGVFYGTLIAEMPFTQKEISFQIYNPGVYSIWQKGKLFQRTPVDKFALELYYLPGNMPVSLPRSVFNVYLNTMDTARMEINRFSAEPGQYKLQAVEGSNVSLFERQLGKLFPGKQVNYEDYLIQVRETKPIYYVIAAIPLFILCGFCIIGGIVAGFLAPEILTDMGISFTR